MGYSNVTVYLVAQFRGQVKKRRHLAPGCDRSGWSACGVLEAVVCLRLVVEWVRKLPGYKQRVLVQKARLCHLHMR